MNKQAFVQLIEGRLQSVYAAWQQDKDVPPVQLFRLEGLIEAACLLGFLNPQQANKLIAAAWCAHNEAAPPPLSEQDIVIPSAMRRAPVYPSTKS